MVQPVRIGIIGAGGIVKSRHLPNLKHVPGVSVVAVANQRRSTAEKVAQDWEIPQVFDSWQDIVGHEEIDAVLIGTPPFLHKELSIAALEAGKHVFCQARMAMNVAEAREMARVASLAEGKGLKAQICLAPTALSVDGTIRRLISEENVLGTLTHGVVAMGNAQYLDPGAPLHWRQQWHISGYNTLDLGLVVEAVHRWIGTFRTVQAMAHTVTRHRPTDGDAGRLSPVERPDIVSILAEHTTGAPVTFLFSGVTRPHERYVEFHGTQGSLRHVMGEHAVSIHRGKGWERFEVPEADRTPWTAEADFVRSIRENASIFYPNPSFRDGLAYMEFTEGVFRSVESGKAITLPLERV